VSILPKQIKKQRRLIVIWNFEVEYASGRRESLRRESNSKAKELRDDLSRAIEIGSVLSFKEYTTIRTILRAAKSEAVRFT